MTTTPNSPTPGERDDIDDPFAEEYDGPYRVTEFSPGCMHCGCGISYTVKYPDESLHHTSFANYMDARVAADDMNAAYKEGVLANAVQAETIREMRTALEASEQCIADFLEVYRRGASMVVIDQAVKSLRDDALTKSRAALDKARATTEGGLTSA